METKNSSSSQIIVACPECEGTQLTRFYEEAGSVCMDCGFVATANIADHTAERNSDGKRLKKPKVLDSESPVTCIGEGSHTDLRVDNRVQNRLLEVWRRTARVSDQTEKNLALALSEITKIGGILSLPKSVLVKAATTYRMIVEKRCVGGRNIRILSAATVYMACKQCDFHCTLNDVAIASNTSRKKIGRSYRFIVKELGGFIPPSKPKKYLPRFLDRLAVSEKTRTTIGKILNAADKINVLCGRNPMSIVAAATYIASFVTGEKKTQREIAEIAHVTEATIRSRYKELMKETLLVITL